MLISNKLQLAFHTRSSQSVLQPEMHSQAATSSLPVCEHCLMVQPNSLGVVMSAHVNLTRQVGQHAICESEIVTAHILNTTRFTPLNWVSLRISAQPLPVPLECKGSYLLPYFSALFVWQYCCLRCGPVLIFFSSKIKVSKKKVRKEIWTFWRFSGLKRSVMFYFPQ